MLKNTKTKAAHTRQKRCHEKPLAKCSGLRQLRTSVTTHTRSHGMRPSTSQGTKYHHSPVRRCDSVRKRSKCSCTKKNCANSGLASDTSTNHGAVRARKT